MWNFIVFLKFKHPLILLRISTATFPRPPRSPGFTENSSACPLNETKSQFGCGAPEEFAVCEESAEDATLVELRDTGCLLTSYQFKLINLICIVVIHKSHAVNLWTGLLQHGWQCTSYPATSFTKVISLYHPLVGVLVTGATSLLLSDSPQDPQAYHTSILTGEGWVRELLAGHPEHIHCELGVHSHVFLKLIEELHRLGHSR